jgi:hypothetical protein
MVDGNCVARIGGQQGGASGTYGNLLFKTANGGASATRLSIVDSGEVGVNLEPADTPPEKLSVDGAVALKSISAPSLTADYAKIYTEAFGNASDTKLLLHMDGSNDGTTFTDSSAGAHSITRTGAVTKTAIKKFGTASGWFDGVNDFLSVPDSTDWDFGTGNWTIEWWIYRTRASNADVIFELGEYDEKGILVIFEAGNDLRIYLDTAGSGGDFAIAGAGTTINEWQHMALVHSGGLVEFFLNGASVGSLAATPDITPTVTTFNIGNATHNLSGLHLQGYLDEFRVCKGTADYTSDFTPQRSAYPVSNIVIMDGGGATYKLGQNW